MFVRSIASHVADAVDDWQQNHHDSSVRPPRLEAFRMSKTATRYVVLVVAILFSLHMILTFSHERYGRATSFKAIAEHFLGSSRPTVPQEYYRPDESYDPLTRRANATFVVLARNSDLTGIITSMKQVEDRFNRNYRYPWVFLNEQPFTDEFKTRTSRLTDAEVYYELIPNDDWVQPSWIDEEKATETRARMIQQGVIYGFSVPYRNMCRFNSGFFYRQERLQNYRYYWRVEPSVQFFCDLHFDPFVFMEDHNKTYGFTISLYEYENTIPTLWQEVKEFIKENPDLFPEDNALAFLSDDNGETYNRCHFWSNFEIGDMDFWRSEAYSKFFDFLDHKGGFYYERWGDAPVHSIGAALFAHKDQIHFFNDIGYRHEPFQHCPQGDALVRGKCWCDESENFDDHGYSCNRKYDALFT